MKKLEHNLAPIYGEREAHTIALWVFEACFGVTKVDIYSGKDRKLSSSEQQELESISSRLQKGEPIQHVLGEEYFGGRRFEVSPAVLIPRPETWDLVEWVVNEAGGEQHLRLLDIGTGSGCIAVSLALELKIAEVEAWDISEEALRVAERNAENNEAKVRFCQADALLPESYEGGCFDIIVSNPPYIGESERNTMRRNVTDFEPSLALFVPDDDTLMFYKAIGKGALTALTEGGRLFFEINERYGKETCSMLREIGYGKVELRSDFTGRDRMIMASR